MHFADLWSAAAFESALLGTRKKALCSSGHRRSSSISWSTPPWPAAGWSRDRRFARSWTGHAPGGVGHSLRICPLVRGSRASMLACLAALFLLPRNLQRASNGLDKPDYSLGGDFQKLNAADMASCLVANDARGTERRRRRRGRRSRPAIASSAKGTCTPSAGKEAS